MKLQIPLLFCVAALTARGADLPPLNSPPTTEYFPGKFIWGDLFTADPPAAERFYTGLFGWAANRIERSTSAGTRTYTVLSVGDRPVAGIALLPSRMADEVHGRWIGYVSVADVAKVLGAATAGGGHVLFPAKSFEKRGTQAVFTDPEGTVLGVMHSSSGDPGEYLPEPGDWTWAELFARDPGAAGAYYGSVLGYDVLPDGRSDQTDDFVLASGGYSRASVSHVPSRPKAHAVWLLFVRVAKVKDAVARAVSLGGRVLVAPTDVPTHYWRAVIADPSGAHLGVVELEDAPTPETAK